MESAFVTRIFHNLDEIPRKIQGTETARRNKNTKTVLLIIKNTELAI